MEQAHLPAAAAFQSGDDLRPHTYRSVLRVRGGAANISRVKEARLHQTKMGVSFFVFLFFSPGGCSFFMAVKVGKPPFVLEFCGVFKKKTPETGRCLYKRFLDPP